MRYLFKILILLIPISGFAQQRITSFEQQTYDKAIAIYHSVDYLELNDGLNSTNSDVKDYISKVKQKVYTKALNLFDELLDTLPNTKLLNRINYTRANIFNDEGEKDLAIMFYKKVIENPEFIYLESENEDNYFRRQIRICLALIYIDRKEYLEAEKQIELAKSYKVQYTCGNSSIESNEELTVLLKKCEEGKK
jgi:tetratricopeptide (TPR) repeat protein